MPDQEASRKASEETLAANFNQWVSKGRRPLTQLKCGCTNLSPSLWAPCDTHRLIVQADVFAVDEVVIGLARITQTARPGTAEVTIAVKHDRGSDLSPRAPIRRARPLRMGH